MNDLIEKATKFSCVFSNFNSSYFLSENCSLINSSVYNEEQFSLLHLKAYCVEIPP